MWVVFCPKISLHTCTAKIVRNASPSLTYLVWQFVVKSEISTFWHRQETENYSCSASTLSAANKRTCRRDLDRHQLTTSPRCWMHSETRQTVTELEAVTPILAEDEQESSEV